MDPRPLGHADARLEHVDERGGVVVRDLLTLVDLGHERGVDDRTSLSQCADLFVGQHADRRQALRRQEFDLDHRVEAALVAEESGHVLG